MNSQKSFLFVMVCFMTTNLSLAQVGAQLPTWEEGYLDIHHINTGRGDATFMIMPDGTTMLVDAGAHEREKSPREFDVVPNDSKQPGEWIAKYILSNLPEKAEKQIDYAVLTHFHSDHLGGISEKTKFSQEKSYFLSGITEVPEYLPFVKMIDRAWPEYDQITSISSRELENYKNFLTWNVEKTGMKIERFEVGKTNQLVLRNKPSGYSDFSIINIVSEGRVWTGVGEGVENHFPEHIEERDKPSENWKSIGFKLSYGKFDYFSGADLLGVPSGGMPDWHDIETPVAKAVGPVEVNVTNHHGHYDAQNEFFIKTLRPKVHIIQSWVVNHPSPQTLSRLLSTRLYDGPRDVYATNISETGKIFGGAITDNIKGPGHIVVRVSPGGAKFHVYILDDTDEKYRVNIKYGPYSCE